MYLINIFKIYFAKYRINNTRYVLEYNYLQWNTKAKGDIHLEYEKNYICLLWYEQRVSECLYFYEPWMIMDFDHGEC